MDIVVPSDFIPQRLDKAIALLCTDISRSSLKHAKSVMLNGAVASLSSQVHGGDAISFEIAYTLPSSIPPVCLPFDIIYEDDDVIVVNKPAGMPVHPSAGHYNDTLVNALLFHFRKPAILLPPDCSEGEFIDAARTFIVHRLDKDTSGVMIAAKTDGARSFLSMEFANRRVKKEYICVAEGVFQSAEGDIDYPIMRDLTNRKRFVAVKNEQPAFVTPIIHQPDDACKDAATVGHFQDECTVRPKEAHTHYFVLEQRKDTALLRVNITTGRTHQIRVHMRAIGHCIAGDPIYGNTKSAKRLMLHAHKLQITLPGATVPKEFIAPIPFA